jgi:hypothetical protein
MSKKTRIQLTDLEAQSLGFDLKPKRKGTFGGRYTLTDQQHNKIKESRSKVVKVENKTDPNNYAPKKLVLSAWNKKGFMMDIDEYCQVYGLPKADITSYKLVSHTGTPFYNIVFKENIVTETSNFDFKSIIKKYIKPVTKKEVKKYGGSKDFDSLTYTDVHIGMESDADNNTMYIKPWNKEELFKSAEKVIKTTLKLQDSNVLYIDDLGDLLDGLDGQTTRGGHFLPQNMTNEQCFDAALEFKLKILYGLVESYDKIYFNNICNDNHSGSFGYFVNEAFKQIAELQFTNVNVINHRKFINHYFVGDICFLISHGKDDKSLKFGFKPQLDLKGSEKIDQYCKQNGIYKKSDLVVFKKGDSHQALFDMCTSDDFFYFNYPAISPSSNWIKNNFKLGRRGFVNESFKGIENTLKVTFI